MRILIGLFAVCAIATSLRAALLNCDFTQYRRTDGLEAVVHEQTLEVRWDGERGQKLRLLFEIEKGTPTIKEIGVMGRKQEWTVLARNVIPEFKVTTGVRRTNHGLPEENRWDVFWDTPLNRTNEVRRFTASFQAENCQVKTDGARLEISFPGLSMGIFSGRL